MTTISLKNNMDDLYGLHNLLLMDDNLCLDNDYCYDKMTDEEKSAYDADVNDYLILCDNPEQINYHNLLYFYMQQQAHIDNISYSFFIDDIYRGITDVNDPSNRHVVKYGLRNFPEVWKSNNKHIGVFDERLIHELIHYYMDETEEEYDTIARSIIIELGGLVIDKRDKLVE